MTDQATEKIKLYDLLDKYVDGLPAGAQSAASARLDGLRDTGTKTEAAYAELAAFTKHQAAAKPTADAALKRSMQTKIFGLTPSTAIIGAIAVSGVAVAATTLIQQRHEAPEQGRNWTSRIARERATAKGQGNDR